MPGLLDLSPELLLSVASFVSQMDLLNVSLTCKRLHDTTEPELYREYSNHRVYDRSVVPFLKRLLNRPQLAKHVHRLDLRWWRTLKYLNPAFASTSFIFPLRDEPSDIDYGTFTEAAKAVGVIRSIPPFSEKSRIMEKVLSHSDQDSRFDDSWCLDIYGAGLDIKDVPYDDKFCQLLRVGLDDPYVVLLMALLPNLHEMFLEGSTDADALPWGLPVHALRTLRRFSAKAIDGNLSRPLSFFHGLIQSKAMETFEINGAGSWRPSNDNGHVPSPLRLPVESLRLTRMVLQWCNFTYADMQTLLSACCILKSFHYSRGASHSGPDGLTTNELLQLLAAHKETLEELCLYMCSVPDESQGSWAIDSLADFHCLRRVETAAAMWPHLAGKGVEQEWEILTDADRLYHRLPPSLIDVVFVAGYKIHRPQIEDLLSLHQDRFPELRSLKIVTAGPGSYGSELRGSATFITEHILEYHVWHGTIFERNDTKNQLLQLCWTGTKYELLDRQQGDAPRVGYPPLPMRAPDYEESESASLDSSFTSSDRTGGDHSAEDPDMEDFSEDGESPSSGDADEQLGGGGSVDG
ncbi:hypothetical protein BU26DRAFT_520126 [Trematosphaeria pertusa]|uniref:F-box domain-containing protein n=1 Tax=Trematosphaeria pertusa TaxID=390896 RepID=A0A6A6IEF6_9PLEO|nr:uncharacterized protein BU26DRAFT_520126 [Trematosphaeria pertusa]KAF2248448.1 hypothetical protein BU26DRAFT_520126 [Trematosphaeria pertusa]